MEPSTTKTSTTSVLELRGIRKSFNIGKANETEILHGIDLSLMEGEFCAVVGPSGSGKSTLLNTVGLLDRPTSGSLKICGQETSLLTDQGLTGLRGRKIGFVFQYHYLLSAFTAIENVMIPMLRRGQRGRRDAEDKARELSLARISHAISGSLAAKKKGAR